MEGTGVVGAADGFNMVARTYRLVAARAEAMVVDFPTAYDHTKHCGPEKQIVFYALSVACTGCGSMKSIEQIRGDHPDALSCCPEPTCTRKPPVNELIPQDTNHD